MCAELVSGDALAVFRVAVNWAPHIFGIVRDLTATIESRIVSSGVKAILQPHECVQPPLVVLCPVCRVCACEDCIRTQHIGIVRHKGVRLRRCTRINGCGFGAWNAIGSVAYTRNMGKACKVVGVHAVWCLFMRGLRVALSSV